MSSELNLKGFRIPTIQQPLCQICHKERFKYTCPRCEVVYCSLSCYKVHNNSCNEEFFFSQVVDYLKSTKPTEQDKKDFEKKLHNVHRDWNEKDFQESDSSDDSNHNEDEESDTSNQKPRQGFCVTEERLQILKNLAKDDQLNESILTKEERDAFHSTIKRGLLLDQSKWSPWWIQRGAAAAGHHRSVIIPVSQHVCCFTTSQVDPRVSFVLIELIYGYVYIMRKWLGDVLSDPLEVMSQLSLLSKCFSDECTIIPSQTLEDCLEGLHERMNRLFSEDMMQFSLLLFHDVTHLLKAEENIQRCLKELISILREAVKISTQTESNHKSSKKDLPNIADPQTSCVSSNVSPAKKVPILEVPDHNIQTLPQEVLSHFLLSKEEESGGILMFPASIMISQIESWTQNRMKLIATIHSEKASSHVDGAVITELS